MRDRKKKKKERKKKKKTPLFENARDWQESQIGVRKYHFFSKKMDRFSLVYFKSNPVKRLLSDKILFRGQVFGCITALNVCLGHEKKKTLFLRARPTQIFQYGRFVFLIC